MPPRGALLAVVPLVLSIFPHFCAAGDDSSEEASADYDKTQCLVGITWGGAVQQLDLSDPPAVFEELASSGETRLSGAQSLALDNETAQLWAFNSYWLSQLAELELCYLQPDGKKYSKNKRRGKTEEIRLENAVTAAVHLQGADVGEGWILNFYNDGKYGTTNWKTGETWVLGEMATTVTAAAVDPLDGSLFYWQKGVGLFRCEHTDADPFRDADNCGFVRGRGAGIYSSLVGLAVDRRDNDGKSQLRFLGVTGTEVLRFMEDAAVYPELVYTLDDEWTDMVGMPTCDVPCKKLKKKGHDGSKEDKNLRVAFGNVGAALFCLTVIFMGAYLHRRKKERERYELQRLASGVGQLFGAALDEEMHADQAAGGRKTTTAVQMSQKGGSDPRQWAAEALAEWLQQQVGEEVADSFEKHDVTGAVFLRLSAEQLSRLGVERIGDQARVRMRFEQMIQKQQ